MSRSFMISVVSVLALTPWTAWGQGYVVRRNFTPGTYELIIEDHVRQTFRGLEAKAATGLETTTRMEFAVRVGRGDPAGYFEMTLTVRRIVQSVQTRGRTVQCDTARDDEPPSRLRQILAPMVGQTLTVQLDAYSRVRKVAGLDAAWGARAKKDPDLADEIDPVRAELGDALVKEALDQITEKLPAVAVQPGMRWQARMHAFLPYGGRRRFRQAVTFTEVTSNHLAVLALAAKVEDKTETVVSKGPPVLRTRRLAIDQNGRFEIGLRGPQPSYRLLLNRHAQIDLTAETPATKDTKAARAPVAIDQVLNRTLIFAPWSPPATQPATRPAGP